jgi:hypothetical protein
MDSTHIQDEMFDSVIPDHIIDIIFVRAVALDISPWRHDYYKAADFLLGQVEHELYDEHSDIGI